MTRDRLKPAKLTTEDEGARFRKGLPWKWILLGAAFAATLVGLFWLRQARRADALRTNMRTLHGEVVTPAAERIDRFRQRIERWTMRAAEEAPEPWADPRLTFAGLHDAQGVYLRIPAEAAGSPEDIAEAARTMGKDAIARCLGLSPTSLRGLYERTGFLSPDWLAQVDRADGLMRLRVLDDDLARRVKRDLPILLHLLQSDYFLLVLERGDDRREAPVDVYLWDLRENRALLRTRTEAEGLLLPVRISMGDAPRTAGKPKLRSAGAFDCSIAAQVKSLTGERPVSVGKAAEKLEDDEPAKSPAGAADAGTRP
ncbi:MAG: hypothetical protein ACODAU_05455 [Myxococcota bacterium]